MSLNKISSGNMQRSASDGGGVNKKKSKDLISVRSDSITGRKREKRSTISTIDTEIVEDETLEFPNVQQEEVSNKALTEEQADSIDQPNANSVKDDASSDRKTTEVVARLIVEHYIDTALDLCLSRFVHDRAADFMVSELRTTWLTITGMQWMDADLTLMEPTQRKASCTSTTIGCGDEPPLPPKFDSWSHGALESLPRRCRESVLDPFLREVFPSHIRAMAREAQEHANRSMSPKSTGGAEATEPSEITGRSVTIDDNLHTRPVSPAPTYSSEDQWTWGTATTTGLGFDGTTYDELNPLLNPSDNMNVPFSNDLEMEAAKKSLELLFPTKHATPDIKASSEMVYKANEKSSKAKPSELTTFKLP